MERKRVMQGADAWDRYNKKVAASKNAFTAKKGLRAAGAGAGVGLLGGPLGNVAGGALAGAAVGGPMGAAVGGLASGLVEADSLNRIWRSSNNHCSRSPASAHLTGERHRR